MPRRTSPNPLAQAIGLRIKQLRREQGLTAEKLAYESELGSKGFLSDIEHGLALPSLTTLDRIAQRLEISVFDLLIVPTRSPRERLIELTRSMGKGSLAKLLRDLSDSSLPASRLPTQRFYAIRTFNSLEVAAGLSRPAAALVDSSAETVALPGKFDRARDFAVRASSHAMAGFRATMRDGDWLVLRRAERPPKASIGEVVLVMREDADGDESLHLKRVVESSGRLWFRSDEASVKPLAVTETDRVLATLVAVVSPEALAPPVHTPLPAKGLARAFGLKREPTSGWSRIEGHLFFVVVRSAIRPRGLIEMPGCSPRPAETAFVLVDQGDSFEYLGVARYELARASWRLSVNNK